MWLLLIIMLNLTTGSEVATKLNTYATLEECVSERNRIAADMLSAYPNDRDYTITCRLNPKHSS